MKSRVRTVFTPHNRTTERFALNSKREERLETRVSVNEGLYKYFDRIIARFRTVVKSQVDLRILKIADEFPRPACLESIIMIPQILGFVKCYLPTSS